MSRRGTAQAVAFTWERATLRPGPAGPPREGLRPCGEWCGCGEVQVLTVWANCSSPASVWNMMWRRRLWKSVQLEALVTWTRGWGWAESISCAGWCQPPSTLCPHWAGAHLAKATPSWHPGLNVELAVGGKAQFLGGHVQDPAATEKDKVKFRVRRREKNGNGGREGSQKGGQWKYQR